MIAKYSIDAGALKQDIQTFIMQLVREESNCQPMIFVCVCEQQLIYPDLNLIYRMCDSY
jgi:hypothetical protein